MLRGRAGGRNYSAVEAGVKRPDLLAGEDLPPEPRQKRSLEKQARLRAAGLALFQEKGYEGASIEEIARRAGLAVGGFYQHFRSKRQLLLALMDELIEKLSQLDLRPKGGADIRSGLHDFLSRALLTDLRYLGAYRAWQEAALSDPGLARRQEEIHAWSMKRVAMAFQLLGQLPNARPGVRTASLAYVMDVVFWSLLGQASRLSEAELTEWIDSIVHLIYHAMFVDSPVARRTK